MSRPVKSIDDAFASVPELKRRIYKAITIQPQNGPLFDDISNYILSLQPTTDSTHDNGSGVANGAVEPPTKKRKLDELPSNSSQPAPTGPRRTILEAREISFTLPQRKKLHLGIVQYGSALNDPEGTFAVQARNPATNQVEFEYAVSDFAYAMRLPVPEKNQKQYNFCLIPRPEKSATTEPLIWTVNYGPLKSCKVDDPDLAKIAPGPEDVLENALTFVLGKSDIKLVLPSEKEFASAIRESHRKNDVTYHVKAHRGSKEGYLFFLENGIFFGFKKPLSFFPFNEIESISYTSVLQRTFNLNITIRTSPEADTQEIEYSMLDQQDFAGIDAYVKDHQLQDSSLADARRAKKANKSKAAEQNGDDDQDGRTELEKAEAELEDEEDELEEDYDPEEDDSGSGSESESDDQEYTRGRGRNLIAEELGSEAEDVTASEDEDNPNDADHEAAEEEEIQTGEQEEYEDEEMDDLPPEKTIVPSRPAKFDPHAPSIDDEDQL